MRVHEHIELLEHKPLRKTDAFSESEAEYARKLYAKYLDYLHSMTSEIRQDSPTEEEMNFLDDFIEKIARQGKLNSVLGP